LSPAHPSEANAPDARAVLFCAEPRLFQSGAGPLAAAGFKPTRAPSWTAALALYDDLRPSVVLVDGAFLDGAGPELCAALRRRSGRVAVPVLALCDGGRDEARALAAGASDVVSRPLRWDRVVLRLAHLWREFRSGLEVERLRALLNEAHREMARTREEAERAGRVDALTGLPNRTRLVEIVQRALGRSQRLEGRVAVLCADLDRFGAVNETLGRAHGDRVLCEVAARVGQLSRCVQPRGRGSVVISAARPEGDAFTLVFTDIVDTGFLSDCASRLLEAIALPISVGDTSICLSASVGIAVASAASGLAEAFLQHGETALHRAKRSGGGRFEFYSEALTGEAGFKLGMHSRLRAACDHEQFELAYQPVLDAMSRRVLGVEALLRWKDPEDGWVSPAVFVPIAEETGLMRSIGRWVLRTACRQLRAWIDDGVPAMRMAVNVALCQLEGGDLVGEVDAALAEHRLDPDLLELELSERGALRDDPTVLENLRRLRALGVRLVVDDFGTGQSAIAYLRRFPLSALKIDRTYVLGGVSNSEDATIGAAMAAMAGHLGLEVVAEGVETIEQLALARRFGCGALQGFLFSPALAPDRLAAAIRRTDSGGELRQLDPETWEVRS
jgi:diguanylate cyclase (GGDEF)-like protein